MKLGNRASQHDFARVPNAQIPRSKFNRSFQRKQTFNADYLVPIFLDEVLPGDTFNLSLTSFARLATPEVPFMDNLMVDYFFFFVPNRLIWDNWERFNGAQDDPGDSTDFTIPLANATSLTVATSTLQNYMGLPPGTFVNARTPISALPFRAYNLIYNTWFRDQNMQNSIVVDKDDGPDTATDYVLRKRGKRHDYFTSCLPWPQKGTAVTLPLGTEAPVFGKVIPSLPNSQGGHLWQYQNLDTGGRAVTGITDAHTQDPAVAPGGLGLRYQVGISVGSPVLGYNKERLASKGDYADAAHYTQSAPYADLSVATAATINQLREAFQVQRLYERDARGGTRYIEIIRSHFGVISSDARLQRPEYLGGGSAAVNISPVAQTSSTDVTTPQGNLAAFGTQIARGVGFQKSFEEHGYVIGLACARADLSYQQGINRMWTRQHRLEFYVPVLSHLSEQAVSTYEIFADGSANDVIVFGYQERFAEYRYKPSEILGEFMSAAAAPLDNWHLAQDFASYPVLDSGFIQSSTPIDRVIAVTSEPHFLWDGWFNYICARVMPTYSVPGLIDHF